LSHEAVLFGLMFCLGSTELEFSTLKISWSDVVLEFTMEPVLAVGLHKSGMARDGVKAKPSGRARP
jgi:hypothetical protein